MHKLAETTAEIFPRRSRRTPGLQNSARLNATNVGTKPELACNNLNHPRLPRQARVCGSSVRVGALVPGCAYRMHAPRNHPPSAPLDNTCHPSRIHAPRPLPPLPKPPMAACDVRSRVERQSVNISKFDHPVKHGSAFCHLYH